MANQVYMLKTVNSGWGYTAGINTLVKITNANYPITTVPGLVYLDGYYFVMDSSANIWNSGLLDPFTWTALGVVQAEAIKDGGVALARYQNYIVAFGGWSMEVFYDAATAAPASPLARMSNLYSQIGCAYPTSIKTIGRNLIWVGQAQAGLTGALAGRAVYMLSGQQTQQISTPAISRVLQNYTGQVSTESLMIGGQTYYLLTLLGLLRTYVYCIETQSWCIWTSATAQIIPTIVFTVDPLTGLLIGTTPTPHGLLDGDVLTVTSTGLSYNITYMDSLSFSINQASATGYTSAGTRYAPTMYDVMGCSQMGSGAVGMSTSSTALVSISSDMYRDEDTPIDFKIVTGNSDGGNNKLKHITRLEVIGDRVAGSAMLRYSKDDYQTHSKYRKVNLAPSRSSLTRIGMARRAAFTLRITDNIPVRIERIDATIDNIEEQLPQQTN